MLPPPDILPIVPIVLIGIGATALMDLWLLARSRLGRPPSSVAFIGRRIGHGPRGRFVHAAIARAEPIRAERALGWLAHCVVGIAFAGLLVTLCGIGWMRQPTLLPALAFGMASVVAPLFVMQPAMGAGFAASRTAAPLKNSLRSLANHTFFGAGLYVGAMPR